MAEPEVNDDNFIYQVGLLPTRELALNFVDYVASRGLKATAKAEFSGAFGIYVARAEDVSRVKLELLHYGNNPFAKAYRQAAWQRGAQVPPERKTQRAGFSFWTLQLTSGTTIFELICVLLYGLSFFPAAYNYAYALLGLYRLTDVTAHFELWRLITPIFFHFGILHIAFNLVMWEALARPLERSLGRLKLLSLTIVIAMLSNALQFAFLAQPAIFGGLSGVVYGLIGYLGVRSLSPQTPLSLRLPRGLLTVSIIFIAFGFFMSGIANFCHAGGLIVGALWGLWDNRRRA